MDRKFGIAMSILCTKPEESVRTKFTHPKLFMFLMASKVPLYWWPWCCVWSWTYGTKGFHWQTLTWRLSKEGSLSFGLMSVQSPFSLKAENKDKLWGKGLGFFKLLIKLLINCYERKRIQFHFLSHKVPLEWRKVKLKRQNYKIAQE